jgi:TolB protein
MRTGETSRVSVANDGSQADAQSVGPGIRGGSAWGPALSFEGTKVAFDSIATNLVTGDTDTCAPFYQDTGRCPDVFVRDVAAGTTVRGSLAADGSQENDASTDPSIDAAGSSVVFFSPASNLVAGDTNTCPPFAGIGHIFVHTS